MFTFITIKAKVHSNGSMYDVKSGNKTHFTVWSTKRKYE